MKSSSSKSQLRTTLKSKLAAISPAQRAVLSAQTVQHALASDQYQAAKTILAYASLTSELDLDGLITQALIDGKRVCIPQIDWDTKAMKPVEIRNLDEDLAVGRYGVRVPRRGCLMVEPDELDLILIPGLGFDSAMNRLGRGAGFYDRMIAGLCSPRPPMVGVCFGCQIIEKSPPKHMISRWTG